MLSRHALPGLVCFLALFASTGLAQSPPFTQCPSIGLSPSCAVLIVINPDGSLKELTDPSVPPFDGVEDTLVGVLNSSGATVFGISLTGPDIFGFDGDGAGPGGSYAGPGTSFTVTNANSGVVNFSNGLNDKQSLWFSLEGSPSQVRLASTVTLDPGHGTINCPKGRTGATGPTNYPASNPPAGHLLEYVLAFNMATTAKAQLTALGYQVVLTKSTVNACPTYSERTSLANKAHSNMFVSIHLDGVANQNVHGSAALYNSGKSSAQTLAQFLVDQISSSIGVTNNGTKIRNDLAVLKATQSRMTAALAEVATLTNVGGDEDVVHNPANVTRAGNAIASAVNSFVNR